LDLTKAFFPLFKKISMGSKLSNWLSLDPDPIRQPKKHKYVNELIKEADNLLCRFDELLFDSDNTDVIKAEIDRNSSLPNARLSDEDRIFGGGYSTGDDALHMAIGNERLDAVRLLLESKSNLESVNNDGRTPLLYSLLNTADDITEYLLEQKANVNAVSEDGLDVFEHIGHRDSGAICKLLLRYGARFIKQKLPFVSDGCNKILRAHVEASGRPPWRFLENNDDIDEDANGTDEDSDTEGAEDAEDAENTHHSPKELFDAVASNNTKQVRLLVASKADVNATHRGRTLLTVAVMRKHDAMVLCLLDFKADVFGALRQAINNGSKQMVTLLLDHEADVLEKDSCGNNVFHVLCFATKNVPELFQMFHKLAPQLLLQENCL
jgi:ankyrin repeat protein